LSGIASRDLDDGAVVLRSGGREGNIDALIDPVLPAAGSSSAGVIHTPGSTPRRPV
jgi:hypothetical protein